MYGGMTCIKCWLVLALIGLFNVFGTYAAGSLGQKLAKRKILAFIYFARSIAIVLFLLALLIVFVGTLAQTRHDIWVVVRDYFRSWFVMVPLKVFFPPAWFPKWEPPEFSLPFLGGWSIGALMGVNLLAAHTIRFRAQARGPKLIWGLATLALQSLVLGLGFVVLAIAQGRAEASGSVGPQWLLAVYLVYLQGQVVRRVQAADRDAALAWGLVGSLAAGTGIWAVSLLGLVAERLPIEVGYVPVLVLVSWLPAVTVSAVPALRNRLQPPRVRALSNTLPSLRAWRRSMISHRRWH